jgi:hypothetical protein
VAPRVCKDRPEIYLKLVAPARAQRRVCAPRHAIVCGAAAFSA